LASYFPDGRRRLLATSLTCCRILAGYLEEVHTCIVRKLVTLWCSLHCRWPLVLIALSGLIAFVAQVLELRINTTASMPIGLYREVPPHVEPGAWVVFCLPEELARLGRERAYLRRGSCPDGSQELLKEIVAVPGDHIVLARAGLTVNGRSIPGSALRVVDRDRRTLPHAPFGERFLGPGELWVLGIDQCVSWDSRYFGPVPFNHVRGAAIPMLTFGAGPLRLAVPLPDCVSRE